MGDTTLEQCIEEALLVFFGEHCMEMDSVPDFLTTAIAEEIAPALSDYKAGKSSYKDVGAVIWATSRFVLRDITDEETLQYSKLMYGAIGMHGHFDS